jgi:uncharacterized protein YecE (DUF72 family)
MLKHYNIATVMTDSPAKENLEFLSDDTVTSADHSFIRFHGRNTKGHYWYDYLYSKEELEPWVEKVEEVKQKYLEHILITIMGERRLSTLYNSKK